MCTTPCFVIPLSLGFLLLSYLQIYIKIFYASRCNTDQREKFHYVITTIRAFNSYQFGNTLELFLPYNDEFLNLFN